MAPKIKRGAEWWPFGYKILYSWFMIVGISGPDVRLSSLGRWDWIESMHVYVCAQFAHEVCFGAFSTRDKVSLWRSKPRQLIQLWERRLPCPWSIFSQFCQIPWSQYKLKMFTRHPKQCPPMSTLATSKLSTRQQFLPQLTTGAHHPSQHTTQPRLPHLLIV